MVGTATKPYVVLTRPEGKNNLLAERLKAASINTICVPALAIEALTADAVLMPLPTDYDLVVFVSGNAARIYLQRLAQQTGTAAWPASTFAATVGVGSAEPLYQSGFIPISNILHPSATGTQDSEALWAILSPQIQRLKRILIVRGEVGREWLGQQFEQAGSIVRRYAVYRRKPVVWSAHQQECLTAGMLSARPLVFLFTSAEGIEAIYANMQRAKLLACFQQARYIATHEKIAGRLQLLCEAASVSVHNPVIQICSPTDDAIFKAVLSVVSL